MLDTHCHIDQYDDPEKVARATESRSILTLAVTSLPSHYRLAVKHLEGFEYVRPALGLHPLAFREHARELPLFMHLVDEASFIGEIGLDFSTVDIVARETQIASFRAVLSALKTRQRFITVHSRGAEEAVLECLEQAAISPVCFHWFSGASAMLDRILKAGHYISINPAMTATKKWRDLFENIPRDRVLTETDGPFSRCCGKISEPTDVRVVLEWIGRQWGCPCKLAEHSVADNLKRITNPVQK